MKDMPETRWDRMGKDLLIWIQGGTSHIGTCVLAQPYQKEDGSRHVTLNTLNRLSHKDDVIASLYAERICRETGSCVVCVCGIHYDDFSPDVMEEVWQWALSDLEKLLQKLKQAPD